MPLSIAFTCPLCSNVSWHRRDRAERFCGRCGFVDTAIAERAAKAGWRPGSPVQRVEVAAASGAVVSASVAAEPVDRGPFRVPFNVVLWTPAWAAVLTPRAMRLLLDLPLAHVEAREDPRARTSNWLPRGVAHGWPARGGPPPAVEVAPEDRDRGAGPLRGAALWRGDEMLLQLRAGDKAPVDLPMRAVHTLDSFLVCNGEARLAA